MVRHLPKLQIYCSLMSPASLQGLLIRVCWLFLELDLKPKTRDCAFEVLTQKLWNSLQLDLWYVYGSSRPICSVLPLCNFSVYLLCFMSVCFMLYFLGKALCDIYALERCYINKVTYLLCDRLLYRFFFSTPLLLTRLSMQSWHPTASSSHSDGWLATVQAPFYPAATLMFLFERHSHWAMAALPELISAFKNLLLRSGCQLFVSESVNVCPAVS